MNLSNDFMKQSLSNVRTTQQRMIWSRVWWQWRLCRVGAFIFMFLGLDLVLYIMGSIIVHSICLHCLEWLCIPDTVTGVLIWLFLICNHSLFEVVLPTRRLSLACHASRGGSQPWGPATAHQRNSECTLHSYWLTYFHCFPSLPHRRSDPPLQLHHHHPP